MLSTKSIKQLFGKIILAFFMSFQQEHNLVARMAPMFLHNFRVVWKTTGPSFVLIQQTDVEKRDLCMRGPIPLGLGPLII